MLGLIWWPLLDQIDWDGAMTHRIGKIHEVGPVQPAPPARWHAAPRRPRRWSSSSKTPSSRRGARRQAGARSSTRRKWRQQQVPAGDQRRCTTDDTSSDAAAVTPVPAAARATAPTGTATVDPERHADATARRVRMPATRRRAVQRRRPAGELEIAVVRSARQSRTTTATASSSSAICAGALSGSARSSSSRASPRSTRFCSSKSRSSIAPKAAEPELQFHRVMPNVTVACPHCRRLVESQPGAARSCCASTPARRSRHMNENGEFDRPLLWYYSPMDPAWSLGHFENRGIVYDSMDELIAVHRRAAQPDRQRSAG